MLVAAAKDTERNPADSRHDVSVSSDSLVPTALDNLEAQSMKANRAKVLTTHCSSVTVSMTTIRSLQHSTGSGYDLCVFALDTLYA